MEPRVPGTAPRPSRTRSACTPGDAPDQRPTLTHQRPAINDQRPTNLASILHILPVMRLLLAALLSCLTALPLLAQSSSFQFHGFLTARAIHVKSAPSWLEGDVGKFDVGGESPDDTRTREQLQAHVGFDWTPKKWLLVHADGVARHEPSGTQGKRAGIVEGYVDLFNDHWR